MDFDEIDDMDNSHYFNADDDPQGNPFRVTIESLNGSQLTEILITKTALLIDFQDGDGLEFVCIPFADIRSMINSLKGL